MLWSPVNDSSVVRVQLLSPVNSKSIASNSSSSNPSCVWPGDKISKILLFVTLKKKVEKFLVESVACVSQIEFFFNKKFGQLREPAKYCSLRRSFLNSVTVDNQAKFVVSWVFVPQIYLFPGIGFITLLTL